MKDTTFKREETPLEFEFLHLEGITDCRPVQELVSKQRRELYETCAKNPLSPRTYSEVEILAELGAQDDG